MISNFGKASETTKAKVFSTLYDGTKLQHPQCVTPPNIYATQSESNPGLRCVSF